MSRRILTIGITVIGIILFLYTMAFLVQEAMRLHAWFGSGSPRSSLDSPDGGTTFTFAVVDSSDFASRPFPAVGDTVLSINGFSIDSIDRIRHFYTDRPNEELSLVFSHHGIQQTSSLITRSPVRSLTVYLPTVQLLRFFIIVSYLLVGLWALRQRPDSAGVRVLALFTFSMASLMISGVRVTELDFIESGFALPAQNLLNAATRVMGLFFGVFWLHLQLLFPRVHPLISRHTTFRQIIIYIPYILYLGVSIITDQPLAPFIISLITLTVTAGMIILGTRRAKAKTSVEKRQLSMVYFGSGIGLVALFIMILVAIVPNVYVQLPTMVRMIFPPLVFTALLASPISFAYAFSRYRLLEVEARFRRGTRYILITLAIVILFIAFVITVSNLILDLFRIDSRTPSIILAIMLSLVFSPAHRRVRIIIERKLYPERFRLRGILDDFLMSTSALPNREVFWNSLEKNLVEGLGIESLIVVEYDPDSESFIDRKGTVVPIDDAGSFVHTLRHETRAVLVDEISDSDQIVLNPREAAWIASSAVHLILPMIVHQRLIGFLGLRFGTEEQDLAAEDLSLIINLVSRIALESENLRLLEESIEKHRLQEQLDMARSVQERFLPRTLPVIPGLHVAARCRFSLEVAGDYYDAFPLDANRSLLAIGDVSGKGAGAAMLMANLRASIRTISAVSPDLPIMVSRLNELIFHDTSSDQFISFFVTVFDADSMVFQYVNAGHNSPRILTHDGRILCMESTGFVLGAFPDSRYEKHAVSVHDSDLFVMFTDGVSEAMNADEVEFGEERIIDIIKSHRNAAPETLIDLIGEKARQHTGQEAFADDFTLLIARVNGSDF